jgi:hypothetical protein
MHMLQSLFYLTTALHVSGVTITHLQEHKINVTTAFGNRYTVIDRVKFTDKVYIWIRLRLQLLLIIIFCRKCNMFSRGINDVHTVLLFVAIVEELELI